MKRPLGWVILCYALGILLGDVVSPPVWTWLALGFFLAAVCLLSVRWRSLTLQCLLLTCGAANLSLNQQLLSPIDLRRLLSPEASLVSVQGVVERVDLRASAMSGGEKSVRTSARLRVAAVRIGTGPWQPAYGWVLATARNQQEPALRVGENVSVFGVCQSPPSAFVVGMFDYRRHLARRGIFHQLEFEGPNDVTLLREAALPLSDRFREWAVATLQRGLPADDPAVGLLWAMTLGWRTSLTDEVAEPFMRSGTMHLFAISGLHIGLMSGILVALLRLVRIPREWVGWVAIPCLWFFTAVTGWQPSAVRATIMMSVIVLGWSLRRPVDLLNSLSAAAFLILLWDPRQLFHAGFQLSFAVVGSIAILLPPLERFRQRLMKSDPLLPPELRPRWQRVLDGPVRFFTMAVSVSVAAWLGSLPLIMHYFHLVTPVGLIANVVVVQLGSLALASGLGSLICAPFIPLFTDLFNHSAWFFTKAMMVSSQWFSGLPMAWRYVKDPPLTSVLCYYVVLWFLVSGWLNRHRRICLPISVVLVGVGVMAWNREYLPPRMTVLPLNGGHAVFLENPGDENWLIDCGDGMNWRFRVRPFLQSQGINRLDNLVLTHGDVRHVGAATNVLEEFNPRRVVLNPVRQRSVAYHKIEAALTECAGNVVRAAAGDVIGRWTILHPGANDVANRADSVALVMRGQLGPFSILHLPDLDSVGRKELVSTKVLETADVLVASPPGDSDFELEPVVKAVRPRLLLVVDSDFPATDRLSARVRHNLESLGVPVVFAKDEGAVQLRWSDRQLILENAGPGDSRLEIQAR